jgi:hypothetical protein
MAESNGAGKGDKYRPVDKKKYDANWDKAFGIKHVCAQLTSCEKCSNNQCVINWRFK